MCTCITHVYTHCYNVYIIVYNNINVDDHVHAGGGVPMSVYYLVNLVGWQGVPITSKGGRTLFQDWFKKMQLFLFALLLPLVAGQVTVTDLAMSDAPTNERGYIIATVDAVGVGAITSPVCGSVNLLTGWIACMSVGWLGVTGAGNAQGLGIEGPNVVTEPILLNDLNCTSFTNTADGKVFECDVSRIIVPVVGCTGDNVAAVSCYFSIGQVAGIAAGFIALCLLLTVLPIILCCVCCCFGICCVASNRS